MLSRSTSTIINIHQTTSVLLICEPIISGPQHQRIDQRMPKFQAQTCWMLRLSPWIPKMECKYLKESMKRRIEHHIDQQNLSWSASKASWEAYTRGEQKHKVSRSNRFLAFSCTFVRYRTEDPCESAGRRVQPPVQFILDICALVQKDAERCQKRMEDDPRL